MHARTSTRARERERHTKANLKPLPAPSLTACVPRYEVPDMPKKPLMGWPNTASIDEMSGSLGGQHQHQHEHQHEHRHQHPHPHGRTGQPSRRRWLADLIRLSPNVNPALPRPSYSLLPEYAVEAITSCGGDAPSVPMLPAVLHDVDLGEEYSRCGKGPLDVIFYIL